MGVMPMAPTEAAPPGTPGTPGLSPPTQPALGEGAEARRRAWRAGRMLRGSGYMPMAPTVSAPGDAAHDRG